MSVFVDVLKKGRGRLSLVKKGVATIAERPDLPILHRQVYEALSARR